MSDRFRGWQPAALEFYEELAVENTKAFWTDHRETWATEVKAPFELLDAEVRDEFGPLHLFRPHRDVRFSKDKTPYKVHQGAVTEGEGGEIYYCHLDAEGLMVATGYYQLAKDQLERFRAAVADDASGPALEAILDRLPRTVEIGGEALKRAPRGVSPDHPRITLLRHKGLTISRRFAPAAWLSTRGALTRIIDTWRLGVEVNDWLNVHVGPSEMPPDDRGR